MMQKLCDEMARLQDRIDAENLWELDHEIEIAMDVMNLPPRDADVDAPLGRRTAACRVVQAAAAESPTCCCWTSRRITLDAEAVNWLERHLADYHGTVVAVTHDRYFLDNVAQWILELDRGRGHSLGRQLLVLAGAEAGAAGAGREILAGAAEVAAARTGVGAHGPACTAGQEQGAHQGL